jgi:hypothetical protein
MSTSIPRPRRTLRRVRQNVLLLWAGIAIGVAFLATPAKFLAPSLSLPIALDVGRATFAVYNRAELGLLALVLLIGAASRAPRRWYLALSVPGGIAVVQAVWLIPALDDRVRVILAGGPHPANSSLHAGYIAAELAKIAALIGFGLCAPERFRGGSASRTAGDRRGRETASADDAYQVPPGWCAMPGRRGAAEARAFAQRALEPASADAEGPRDRRRAGRRQAARAAAPGNPDQAPSALNIS